MKLFISGMKEVAEDTLAVELRPESPLRFEAGQFGDFTLTDPPYTDERGNTRTFSLASAPGNDRIVIATRLRDSAFKRSLQVLPVGSSVRFMGPMGSFVLHKDPTRPAVFLVGGIGITPVRSIVEEATLEAKPHRIIVFYSDRTLKRMAFIEDLQAWSLTNANLQVVPVLTQETSDDRSYETGPIDQQMLSRHVGDMQAPIYYLVGPPRMVAAMHGVLQANGIDELQIKSEDFAGY